MQKILSILTLIFISSSLNASNQSQLVHCLALEEEGFHKSKKVGPHYQLNQTLMNEIISIGDLDMHREYLSQFCQKNEKFMSLKMVKVMMLNGEKVFFFRSKNAQSGSDLLRYRQTQVKDFLNRIPHLFFDFLSSLQSTVRDPHCLTKNVPGLEQFKQKIQYLESEVAQSELGPNQAQIESLFRNVMKFDEFKAQCTGYSRKISK